MRVIISAGGTGGHIYPAIAIINKIREVEKDSEFLYIGTHNRMEKDIIPSINIPYRCIEIYGFNRKNIFKNLKTIKCLFKANKECKKIISEFDPDVVIGVGGYVTTPVIRSAKNLGYKTLIHEQNSVPGKANLYLEKYADKIAISFDSSKEYFKSNKTIYTGNPCSENSLKVEAISKKDLDLDENKKLVVFVMGSLGSSKMNDFIISSMNAFKNKNYQVLFITGKSSFEKISKLKFPTNVKVVPYIENLSRVMKVTDVMVSRAGASTLSEIIALNVPAILIPSPYVTNNHQYKNALDLEKHNACILLEEKTLSKNSLVENIDLLINDKEKIKEIKNNLENMSIKNSASMIYNSIKELVGK